MKIEITKTVRSITERSDRKAVNIHFGDSFVDEFITLSVDDTKKLGAVYGSKLKLTIEPEDT